jgi:hypothetical protein
MQKVVCQTVQGEKKVFCQFKFGLCSGVEYFHKNCISSWITTKFINKFYEEIEGSDLSSFSRPH